MEPEAYTWTNKKPLSVHINEKKKPLSICINKKEIFRMAAERLSLYITAERSLPLRDNDFSAVIEVAGLKAHGVSELDPRKFYGDFLSTPEQAINSAYNQALKFLINKELIIIDDINYSALQRTKSHLAESETYLMLSEDSGSMLENELDFKIQGYKALRSISEMACKEASTILPLSITKEKNPQTGQEYNMVTFTGDASSTAPTDKLALSLVEMHQIIKVHGYEIDFGDHSTMKEYWNRAAQRDDN